MRLWSFLLSTLLAVAVLVFHVLKHSTWSFAFWRVSVTWIGLMLLCYGLDRFLSYVFGPPVPPPTPNILGQRPLELISRPEDDEYFR